MMRWLAAFAITQLVEMPIYARALRGKKQRLAIAFGASAITHPIVWFVVPVLWLGNSYAAMILASEIFAVVAEAIWLARFGVRRAFVWALVANGASVTIGFAIRAAFGWP
jgi:hypothetical protein